MRASEAALFYGEIMQIVIKTIPSEQHRYPTCGDYWVDPDGTRQIRVSDMKNWKYELLVAVHELVEQNLCLDRGIDEKDISRFDIRFEKARAKGKHSEDAEPGDDPKAPYRKEHFTATNIERILAAELGIDWTKYDKAVMES